MDIDKNHFLLDANGVSPIEHLHSVRLNKRILAAWEIMSKPHSDSTPAHQAGAHSFLKKTFALSDGYYSYKDFHKLVSITTEKYIPSAYDLARLNHVDMDLHDAVLPDVPTYKMVEIHEFSLRQGGGDLFWRDVKRSQEVINRLIVRYNTAHHLFSKTAALQELYKEYKLITYTYKESEVNKSEQFRKIFHYNLYEAIKNQAKILGIKSLYNFENISVLYALLAKPRRDDIEEILSWMDPVKVDQLIQILAEGEYFEAYFLEELFQAHEPGFNDFQMFLQNNRIEFLDGINSKNFKITPIDGSPVRILKLENRLTVNKMPEYKLRQDEFDKIFTADYCNRQGSYNDGANWQTRRLVLTEFCAGGNLKEYGQMFNDETTKISSALHFFLQMGEILEKLQGAEYVFPDMKLENWIVDGEILRIADTKSITYTHSDLLCLIEARKVRSGIICTPENSPPELNYYLEQFKFNPYADPPPLEASKLHAYMFGFNLFYYLTDSLDENSKVHLSFKHDVFKSEAGLQLKIIIWNLLEEDPCKRLGVSEALLKLQKLKQQEFVKAFERAKELFKNEILKRQKTINEANFLLELSTGNELEGVTDFESLDKTREQYENKMKQAFELFKESCLRSEDVTLLAKNQISNACCLDQALDIYTKHYHRNIQLLKRECSALLSTIQAKVSLGPPDDVLHNFIRTMEDMIADKQPHQLNQLKQEWLEFIKQLDDSKPLCFLRERIVFLEGEKHGAEKKQKIIEAFHNIPVLKRMNIEVLSADQALHKALASQRGFFRSSAPTYTAEGKVDPEKNARSLKLFKKLLTEETNLNAFNTRLKN